MGPTENREELSPFSTPPPASDTPLRGAPASTRAGSIPGTRALLPDHPTPNKDTLWGQVGVGPLRPHPSTEGQMGGRRPQMLPCLFSIHPGTQNRLIHPWACSGLHPILLQLYEVAKASERPKQQVPELISHLNHSLNLTLSHWPTSENLSHFSKDPNTFLQPWVWRSWRTSGLNEGPS